MSDLNQRLGDILRLVLWIPAILVAAVAAVHIKPLQDLQRHIACHPGLEHWLKALTFSQTVLPVNLHAPICSGGTLVANPYSSINNLLSRPTASTRASAWT